MDLTGVEGRTLWRDVRIAITGSWFATRQHREQRRIG
jgi:hypothetical protein